MKKRTVSQVALFSVLSTVGIQALNIKINEHATSKNLLNAEPDNYYKWKNLKIYYTKKGTTGSPVILLHDLNPSASSAEWFKLEEYLSKNHRVYSIDLLGCGRSDKPELTYTNFYFVQLLIDFIKYRICEKSFVVASGYTCSLALMASVYDPSKFSGLFYINPPSIKLLSQVPTYRSKIAKKMLEVPIIGSLIYNMLFAREAIYDYFTEKTLYNPFLVDSKLIDTYYKSAHLKDGNGRYLQASLSGNYINMNIEYALKNCKVHTDILIGSALRDSNYISRSWKQLKKDISIYSITKAKNFPHIEDPESTASYINDSITETLFSNRF